jgi:hypothetical protein
MILTHLPRVAVISLALSSLAACGGSGGGGGTGPGGVPGTPTVSTAIGVKQLQLGWNSVPGATMYRIKQNPDGVSGYTQVGADLPAGQTSANIDVTVYRQDWLNARYLVEACNSIGCTASNEVNFATGATAAIGYLKAADAMRGDQFGYTTVLSGDGATLAVGAPNRDGATGAVYIFTRDGNGTWSQQETLTAANAGSGDQFGHALSLSSDGNTLAVGAYKEDGPDEGVNGTQAGIDTVPDSGAAYVFTRDGGLWSQQAYVKSSNNNTGNGDWFGYAVALSGDGDTLGVGSIQEDGGSTGVNGQQLNDTSTNSGAVYVFTRDGTGTWIQRAYVKASNTGPGDNFGNALALDDGGDTLAVGAYQEDSDAPGINGDQLNSAAKGSGAVYVFTRDGTGTWSQQAYVKASNPGADDNFGDALSLAGDGNTLAVGALSEDGSKDNIVSAGATYVFTRDTGTTWSQQAYIQSSNAEAGDQFGAAVALSADGDSLAVGANHERSAAQGVGGDQADNSANASGAAYLFTLIGGGWQQLAYIKASNTDDSDNFGVTVALSADGSTLAVGANLEDGAATGIDGDQTDNHASAAGAAYLY